MVNLADKVGSSIRARKLFRRGQGVLVAVSGGVDSMVLLHVLHALASKQGWRLTVAHCNHQLRGRSSEADERLVRATAKELGLPFVAGRVDVRSLARAKKVSTEMAARELRHQFLARTARRLKIPTIALAHHVDDQVELFFLRLFRGSGGEGLAGMDWRGRSPVDGRVEVVRPLLDQSKAAVRAYAAREGIKFREDASNRSADFQRNRIRHRLLPFLKREFQPLLGQAVWRTMEVVGAENDFVCASAENWLRGRRPRFARLPVAVQRRVVQEQLRERGVTPDFDLIEWLRTHEGKPITISGGNSIIRDGAGRLKFGSQRRADFQTAEQGLKLGGRAGRVEFAGKVIQWRIERVGRFRRPKPVTGRELFDADLVGAEAVLRHWRAGDRFQPIGMKAAVKLQDLFVNAKIPRERRRGLIVGVAAGGDIFWVEGLRMSERFKLGPATKRRLRWQWKKAR